MALHPKQDTAGFAKDKATLNGAGQPTTDLQGLGNQAYASLLQSPDKKISIVTLVARKDTTQITVRSPTTLDPAFQLMQRVLGRL